MEVTNWKSCIEIGSNELIVLKWKTEARSDFSRKGTPHSKPSPHPPSPTVHRTEGGEEEEEEEDRDTKEAQDAVTEYTACWIHVPFLRCYSEGESESDVHPFPPNRSYFHLWKALCDKLTPLFSKSYTYSDNANANFLP